MKMMKMRLHNGKLDIFRQLFGLVAFDKARDNNFVVRDEGTSPAKLINCWLALSLGSASFNVFGVNRRTGERPET